MNIAVVYYSYSGNTHRACQIIAEILKPDNLLSSLRIEAPRESNNFFIQALRGLTKRKTEISPIEANLSAYDLIIFGTPVWAREAPPAMRSYLERVTGLFRKKAIIFVTYGSGLGREHCLDSLERTLKEKGVSVIKRFSLSQFKVNGKALIESLVTEALTQRPNEQTNGSTSSPSLEPSRAQSRDQRTNLCL